MADGSWPPRETDLMPQTATPLERALSATDRRMLTVPTQIIRDVWDPDACPVAILPYLAAAWSVDEWDPAWTESQKRQAIKDAAWIHRHKGTIGAVKRALAQIGLPATVREWFQYGGAPFTFHVRVTLAAGVGWSLTETYRAWRVALRAKNVRSYIDTIEVVQPAPAETPLRMGVTMLTRVKTRFVIDPVQSISMPQERLYIGSRVLTRSRVTILPRP